MNFSMRKACPFIFLCLMMVVLLFPSSAFAQALMISEFSVSEAYQVEISPIDLSAPNEISFTLTWKDSEEIAGQYPACEEKFLNGAIEPSATKSEAGCRTLRQLYHFTNTIVPTDARIIKTVVVYDSLQFTLDKTVIDPSIDADAQKTWKSSYADLADFGIAFYGADGAALVDHEAEANAGFLIRPRLTKTRFSHRLYFVGYSYGQLTFKMEEATDFMNPAFSWSPLDAGTWQSPRNVAMTFLNGRLDSGTGGKPPYEEFLAELEKMEIADDAISLTASQYVFDQRDLRMVTRPPWEVGDTATAGLELRNPHVVIDYIDNAGRRGQWHAPIQHTLLIHFDAANFVNP